jgi:hypothetical protein
MLAELCNAALVGLIFIGLGFLISRGSLVLSKKIINFFTVILDFFIDIVKLIRSKFSHK